MCKKYELTNETITSYGHTLYRIKALKDFRGVKKGDLGGFIEKEVNLSQKGNAWVYGNARVYGNASIYGNAKVCDNAGVCENAKVYENASVCGDSLVCGNASIYGDSLIYGNAMIYGDAKVYENALIYGYANILGDARVYGECKVYGDTKVIRNAIICGNAEIYGNSRIDRNAKITSPNDFATISNFGSENRTTTFFRNIDNQIIVACGCFYGTLDEFRERIKKTYTYKNTYLAKEYLMVADLMEFRFNNRN